MTEIVFFPDGGGSFLIVFGGVLFVIGGLAGALLLRKQLAGEHIGAGAWAGVAVFAALGAVLAVWCCSEARGVSVRGSHVVLRYRWPHPDRALDARDIRVVRIEYRGTEHPSPRLVLQTIDDEILEGEGTNAPLQIERAKAAIEQAMGAPATRH